MKSLANKIKQLEGLLGTGDLTEWEERFVDNVVYGLDTSGSTTHFTGKQVEIIDRIFNKHFAG